MSKPSHYAVRVALLGLFVLWGLFALANPDGAVSLLERTVSADGRIQNRTYAVCLVGEVLLALALLGPVVLDRWRSALADLSQAGWWTKGSEVPLVFALILIHAIGIVQYDSHYVSRGIYREDALLENFSALLALGAALLFLIGRPRADRPSQIFASLMAVVAILFAGEEISWGQRIFGIESIGAFAEANYQRETNVHNFLHPAVMQQILMMLHFAATIWLLNARAATRWLVTRAGCADIQPLVNPPDTLILAPVMFGLGLYCAIYGSELSEEVLAVMLFYGSLRFMLAQRGLIATAAR